MEKDMQIYFQGDIEKKNVKVRETKTVTDEFGNTLHISALKEGNNIKIVKAIEIPEGTDKKTIVDTMRKEGFKNKEIANVLEIGDSRVSQIAHSPKVKTKPISPIIMINKE